MIGLKLVYQSKNAKLTFNITGKFNVIIGKSGSGKTDLTRIAELFCRTNSDKVLKPKPIYTNLRNIDNLINNVHNSLFVIDEGFSKEEIDSWVPRMKESDNYYIFITRDGIAEVPYGINSIFELKGERKHYYMEPVFNSDVCTRNIAKFDYIITEDSKIGFKLVELAVNGKNEVISSSGKDNIVSEILKNKGLGLILFDKCGIGNNFFDLFLLQRQGRCILFDKESFEYEILTRVFYKTDVSYGEEEIISYSTEEDYYIKVLSELLKSNFGIAYSKSSDNVLTLLEEGKVLINKNVINLRSAGGKVKGAYPELRDEKYKDDDLNKLKLF